MNSRKRFQLRPVFQLVELSMVRQSQTRRELLAASRSRFQTAVLCLGCLLGVSGLESGSAWAADEKPANHPTRTGASFSAIDDPCGSVTLTSFPLCLDRQGRRILWLQTDPGSWQENASWQGFEYPPLDSYSANDVAAIGVLGEGESTIVLFRHADGSLFSWRMSSPKPVRLEASGVRAVFAWPDAIYYVRVLDGQNNANETELLRSLGADGTVETLWRVCGRRVVHVYPEARSSELRVVAEHERLEEEWAFRDGSWQLVETKPLYWKIPLSEWRPVGPLAAAPAQELGRGRGRWRLRRGADGEIIASSQASPSDRGAAIPFWIPLAEGREGDRFALEVDDGLLIAFDMGEWGGGLWWYSKDGSKSYELYSGDLPVREVLDLGSEIVAVSRGAGGVRVAGKRDLYPCMWRIRKGSLQQWRVAEVLKCDGVYASLREGESLLFASVSGLYRYQGGEIARLHEFGNLVFPVSLLPGDGGSLWVSLLNWIVRLDRVPDGWREQWFIPPP